MPAWPPAYMIMPPLFSPPPLPTSTALQEVRRSAELDSRGVRAEELRLRDLAVSLEARAEEVRRREREGARGREDALQAARHEARQSLEVKEEDVARQRCGVFVGRGWEERGAGGGHWVSRRHCFSWSPTE